MFLTGVVHGRIVRLARTTNWNNEIAAGALGQFVFEHLPSATARKTIDHQIAETSNQYKIKMHFSVKKRRCNGSRSMLQH